MSVEMMQSQVSDDATQVISQSVYMELIRSRIEATVQKDDGQDNNKIVISEEEATHVGNTQFTYDEGDTGFLDLISSLPTPHKMSQPLVPSEISPVQSQMPLTQFPESQRFKTPATAGKKRDYTGNILETPAISKNPLESVDNSDKVNLLGLSQAFAATQAATSPLAALPTSALRSDRPSPQVDVSIESQQLPISSPLRPLLSSKRAAAEPAVRYVSVEGSQGLNKDKGEHLEIDEDHLLRVDFDEDLDHEPSEVTRKRREKLRENQARRQIQRASSHLSPRIARTRINNDPRQTRSVSPLPANVPREGLPSSPPPSSNHKTNSELYRDNDKILSSDDPQDASRSTSLNFSKLTTLRRLSQRKAGTTLVPQTTKKILERRTRSRPGNLESPLPDAHHDGMILQPLESPAFLPVGKAKARNLHTFVQSTTSRVTDLNLSQESIDRIPASPESPMLLQGRPELPAAVKNAYTSFGALPKGINSRLFIDGSGAEQNRHIFDSIVPETSSAMVDNDVRSCEIREEKTKNSSLTATVSDRPHSSTTSIRSCNVDQVRSPDPKRKRISDLSQDLDPLMATQSSTFDAADFLALDNDPDYAKALASIQDDIDSDPVIPHKRRRRRNNKHTTAAPLSLIEGHGTSTQDGLNQKPQQISERKDRAKLIPGKESRFTESSSPSGQTSTQSSFCGRPESTSNSVIVASVSKQSIPAEASNSSSDLPIEVQSGPQPRTRRSLRKSWESTAQDTTKNFKITDLRPVKTNNSRHDLLTNSHEFPDTPCTPVMMPNQVKAPTMIFAYYMRKTRAYYPAICLALAEDGQQYKIRWPGYEADTVAGHGICALDVRIGDEVKVDREGFPKTPFVIKGFEAKLEDVQDGLTDIYGHTHAQVMPKEQKPLVGKSRSKIESVPIRSLYLDLAMWNRISKRPSPYQQHFKVVEVLPCTPIARTSTPSTASCRSRNFAKDFVPQITAGEGIFNRMIFALTFESEATKQQMSRLIQTNGGTILTESFADLVDHTFKLKPEYCSAGFTALITDRHSRKGKYMQALALGVPCLNSRWVIASLESSSHLYDWQDYLLPAGECAEFGGAVRSRTIAPIEVTTAKLNEVFNSRKDFFDNAQIVFVLGRCKSEKRKEQRSLHLFFVQAMTPNGNVQVAADLDEAVENMQKLDRSHKTWLIVADEQRKAAESRVEEVKRHATNEHHTTKRQLQRRRNNADRFSEEPLELGIEVADSEFVMQSLIFGRLCRN